MWAERRKTAADDDVSSLTRFTGTTVDWIMLRNRPTLGSMSSGLMTISSSLNDTFLMLRLRELEVVVVDLSSPPLNESSVMPSIEIRRLVAVLYSVRFWNSIVRVGGD